MMRMPILLLAVLLLLEQSTTSVVAFSVSSSTCVNVNINNNIRRKTLLQSTNAEDDEISKLIGRRSQIKRKKKEAEQDDASNISPEALVDLDLDKLPEFKTERPVRRAKSENDADENKNEEDGDDKSSKSDIPIIDFKADYDDENEWHIPNRIIASTKAWGDTSRGFVASGKLTKRMLKEGKFVPGDLQLAHTQLLEQGILAVETSPQYGQAGRGKKLSAEHILKRCLDEAPTDVLPETLVVETYQGNAWLKPTANRLAQPLYDSVELLGTSTVELYQVPKSFLYPTAWITGALSQAIESGCCNYVGVQGITSRGKLAKLCRGLERQDMALTTNAFEFSLTKRQNEAMFDTCQDFSVTPLVLNPLDDGLASGVYTATNPSGGQATTNGKTKFTFKELERLQPLHSVQETVAERVATRVKREMRDLQDRYRPRYGPAPKINTDITTTQVAINYVIAKGGVPVVEVNSPKDVQELAGSLGWTLTDEEVDMLENAAALCKL